MEEPQARLRAMSEVLQIIALAIVLVLITSVAFRDLLGRALRAA